MNVSCTMNEAEIKEAIALWFLQRHGVPGLPMNQITLKASQTGNYHSSDISASITLNEAFLQKINKKKNEDGSYFGEKAAEGNSKVAEDIFPPKKKTAKLQLDVE